MRNHIGKVIAVFVSCSVLTVSLGTDNATDCLTQWRGLVLEGSNLVARTSNVCMKQSPQEWFCEIARYEFPTNNVAQYKTWMNEKANLIESVAWILNTDQSVAAWNALADFLADIKNRFEPCNSGQFAEKHIEEWKKDNHLSTLDEWQKWRKAYLRDRRYRSIWGRASMEMEHAVEQTAKCMPLERRKRFMEIIIAKTKSVPEWYKTEITTNGSN